jgi:NADP-dependent 3-hydroxy acid dehydrogenase YdfG
LYFYQCFICLIFQLNGVQKGLNNLVMTKIALITGATSGIGKACAEKFASESYDLILTGRREDRLNTLKAFLEKEHAINIITLCFDVRDQQEVQKQLNGLPASWKKIDVLINNAGLAAGKDPIQDGLIEDWDRMIDTNVKGLLYISKTVIPWLIAQKKGDIINIASIAGKEVYPDGNVYCASKFAVDALSKAMRIDLVKEGIRVTNIAPGLVETEFSEVRFHGNKELAATVYKDIEALQGKDIADCIWFAVSRPSHVQIGDMLILPRVQASSTIVHKG